MLDDERAVCASLTASSPNAAELTSGRERAQPRDFALHRLRWRVSISSSRREAAEAEPQRALRELIAVTERTQHVRASSEAEEHAEPADTASSRNANCRLSPSTPWKLTFSSTATRSCGCAVQLDVADGANTLPQPIAQRADARDVLFTLARSELEREAHADDLVRRQACPSACPAPDRRRRSAA